MKMYKCTPCVEGVPDDNHNYRAYIFKHLVTKEEVLESYPYLEVFLDDILFTSILWNLSGNGIEIKVVEIED